MSHVSCTPESSHYPDCLCDPPATPRCAYVPLGVLKSGSVPDPVVSMNRFGGLYLPWESSGYCAAVFNSLKDGTGPRVNVIAHYREGIGQNYEPGVRVIDTAKDVETFWEHRTDYLANMLSPALDAAVARLYGIWHDDSGGGVFDEEEMLFHVWNYAGKDCNYDELEGGRYRLNYNSGKGWRVLQHPVVLSGGELATWLADRDAWVPLRTAALASAEAQYKEKYPHEY